MDLIDQAFQQALSKDAIATVATELLLAKLKQKGITLSYRQRRAFRNQILDGKYPNIKIDPWKFWHKRRVEFEITDSDIKNLEYSVARLMEQLPEILEAVWEKLAVRILDRLKKCWPKQARFQKRQKRGFRKHLVKQWGKPLGLLEMLLTIAKEYGEGFSARLRSINPSLPNKVEVLTRLQARACQVASEILVLLNDGFADGAIARWRTLHEIAVVSLFISEGNESLAERYILHQAIESWRAAMEYQKHHKHFGFAEIAPQTLDDLERQRTKLKHRFGPAFLESYGWASEKLGGTKKPNFTQIEQAIAADYLRPFYRMASHNVHANPKGAFFKLGLSTSETDVLLAGPSSIGLTDPIQYTALSLAQASTGLFMLDPNHDAIVALKITMDLNIEIREVLATFHDESPDDQS